MLILKGFIIGIGKVIPGISGSVLAISMGIYDKLIKAICTFFKEPKKNSKFLLQIFLGIALAILFGSKIIYYFIENYYGLTIYLIIGFIFGEVPNLVKEVNHNKKNIIFTIIPFLVVLSLNLIMNSTIKTTTNSLIIIFLGVLEAITTIIPGLSGTSILINLGYYNYVLNMISSFNYNFLIFYCLGIIVGLVSLVKIVNYLLTYQQEKFKLIINGLVFSSLLTIILKTSKEFNLLNFIALIIAFILSYLNSKKQLHNH